jgi:hypothetical protein
MQAAAGRGIKRGRLPAAAGSPDRMTHSPATCWQLKTYRLLLSCRVNPFEQVPAGKACQRTCGPTSLSVAASIGTGVTHGDPPVWQSPNLQLGHYLQLHPLLLLLLLLLPVPATVPAHCS